MQVGDGRRTAFWLDVWCGEAPFSIRWTALFSDALDIDATILAVLSAGFRRSLVPRLNHAGTRQLPSLLAGGGDPPLR